MTRLLRFVWFLPRNGLIVVLRSYRAIVSPLYGDVCRYYPSCSAYALGSVQQHGVVRGGALSLWRLLRCNPWADGGIDDVLTPRSWIFPTPFGFVRGTHPLAYADRAAGTVDLATITEFIDAGTDSSRRASEHAYAHSHGKG